MEEVKGELVDKIKDLPYKIIYRKIGLLLHPDQLLRNQEVTPYPEYLTYLQGVYLKILNTLKTKDKKEDKATMLMIIQDA
jgi:hypothetical protein